VTDPSASEHDEFTVSRRLADVIYDAMQEDIDWLDDGDGTPEVLIRKTVAHLRSLPIDQRMEVMGMEPAHWSDDIDGYLWRAQQREPSTDCEDICMTECQGPCGG
jgi:hypothetical protein